MEDRALPEGLQRAIQFCFNSARSMKWSTTLSNEQRDDLVKKVLEPIRKYYRDVREICQLNLKWVNSLFDVARQHADQGFYRS
jgi:endonuclease III